MDFETIQGVVADMDGVLWRGDEPIKGMQDFFTLLDDAALPFILATNNSAKTPTDYVEKLSKMGVTTVTTDNILTSGTATVDFLLREYPIGADVYVLGGAGLHQLIADAGFSLVEKQAEVVIVGLDRDINYDKLKLAALNIRGGARFIATNPDKTFPAPEGLIPGNGSLVAAVIAATDTEPEYIGKPHPPMFETALTRLGTPPAQTLMIGDRINTDIEGALTVGMRTILLLSGVTTTHDMTASPIQPELAYESILDVVKAWNYTGGRRRR